jgi:hypothetical protein
MLIAIRLNKQCTDWICVALCFTESGGSLRKPPKVETKTKKPPTPPPSKEKKKKETPPKSDPYFAMETEDLPVCKIMFNVKKKDKHEIYFPVIGLCKTASVQYQYVCLFETSTV